MLKISTFIANISAFEWSIYLLLIAPINRSYLNLYIYIYSASEQIAWPHSRLFFSRSVNNRLWLVHFLTPQVLLLMSFRVLQPYLLCSIHWTVSGLRSPGSHRDDRRSDLGRRNMRSWQSATVLRHVDANWIKKGLPATSAMTFFSRGRVESAAFIEGAARRRHGDADLLARIPRRVVWRELSSAARDGRLFRSAGFRGAAEFDLHAGGWPRRRGRFTAGGREEVGWVRRLQLIHYGNVTGFCLKHLALPGACTLTPGNFRRNSAPSFRPVRTTSVSAAAFKSTRFIRGYYLAGRRTAASGQWRQSDGGGGFD